MRYIELINGERVDLNTKLSLGMLLKAQNEKMLSDNFLKCLLNMAMSGAVGGEFDVTNIDANDLVNLTYICYLNAGGHEYDKDAFLSKVPFDLELLFGVYTEVLLGGADEQKSKLADNFRKVTPASKNRSKKKRHN